MVVTFFWGATLLILIILYRVLFLCLLDIVFLWGFLVGWMIFDDICEWGYVYFCCDL